MDNLQAVTDIKPSELPEGFTAAGDSGAAGSAEQQKKQAAEEQKQAILEQALTQDALARLRRIKMVKTDKAQQLENTIVAMAMAGKLPGRINEGKLIEMLERGSTSANKEGDTRISIQRKKYALDSDDDDDDDDL